MLGVTSDSQLTIEPETIHGLEIRLVESPTNAR